jgi:hypothetical protein
LLGRCCFCFSHSISPFLWWVFWDRVSGTICLGWLRTAILLISASWVAGITGMGHQRLAFIFSLRHLSQQQKI